MSILIKKEPKTETEKEKLIITLDNGHIEALDKIVSDYNLLGESEALSFMLSILSQANGTGIEINGTTYTPSEKIKK